MLDYYNLLQVPPEATAEAIRNAFRRGAKRQHPDAQPGAPPAEREARQRRFILLAQAYDTLRDPARRRAYDRQWRLRFGDQGASSRRRGAARGGAGGGVGGAQRRTRATGGTATGGAAAPVDWEHLLRDVEELLGHFGLDLKQPFERVLETLLDWARALFREVAGPRTPRGRSREGSAARRDPRDRSGEDSGARPGKRGESGSPRAPAAPHGAGARPRSRRTDPERIERELAELKRRAGRQD